MSMQGLGDAGGPVEGVLGLPDLSPRSGQPHSILQELQLDLSVGARGRAVDSRGSSVRVDIIGAELHMRIPVLQRDQGIKTGKITGYGTGHSAEPSGGSVARVAPATVRTRQHRHLGPNALQVILAQEIS